MWNVLSLFQVDKSDGGAREIENYDSLAKVFYKSTWRSFSKLLQSADWNFAYTKGKRREHAVCVSFGRMFYDLKKRFLVYS